MADSLVFDAGRAEVAAKGVPAICVFLLSSKAVGSLGRKDTATMLGEITGTGYTRIPVDAPPVVAGNPSTVHFPPLVWKTGEAEDWPEAVRSVVMLTADQVPVFAWNLREGGKSRNMSQQHTTQTFTPTLTLT